MKAAVNTTIHNRFDIFKTNTETGKTEQVAYAENIILNQMWPRIVGRLAYFVNIHYGTNSDNYPETSMDPIRVSLFNHLGTKVAVDDTLTKTLPVATWRRKIVLAPEDNVGSVLREVGIAYDSAPGHLVTHALLKDMNGNSVALVKTALDVITIYATIYVTFSTTNPNIQICGLPNNNPLMNYLIGGTALGPCFFYTGTLPLASSVKSPAVNSIALGVTAAVALTGDSATKKITSEVKRFAVGESNGHITEVGFGTSQSNPIFRILLPADGIYSGLDLTGISVGSGDATTRKFTLPSNNVKQTAIALYLDGILTTGYAKQEVPITARAFQTIFTATNSSGKVIFSRDGSKICIANYLIAPTDNTAVFELTGSIAEEITFTKAGAGQTCSGAAFSDNGNILAICYSAGTDYVRVYDLVANAYVLRAAPSVPPTGPAYGVALSSNGTVMAIAHNTAPYVSTYDWTAGAWVKRANPAVLPASNGISCSISSDGNILAIAVASSPYILVYDWTAGAWVKRADPAVLPTGAPKECTLSTNGLVLSVVHAVTPFFTVYDWTAGAWVKRANPASLPEGTPNGGNISSDGTLLVIGLTVTPWTAVYRWINAAWQKLASLEGTVVSSHAAISGNGKVASFTCVTNNNPNTRLNYFDIKSTDIIFDTAPANGAVITADYTVAGIHKTIQRIIDLGATFTFGEIV